MGEFIVSARKYRPASFEKLLGQENIARTLKNSILRGQLAHAYLFCGPRGVGKTSAARIFARTINCSNPGPDLEPCGECESCRSFAEGRSYSIHELDAASNNSVDDIRQLTDSVRIPPQVGRYSVYIIDEVHMLSQAAFNAFLKTLEEPPAHAIFILATTEKHKILPTILSRCQTYDFNRITIEDMVRSLKSISEAEGVNISEDAMHVIAQKADGAMRDALTLFDQTVAFCGKDVTYEQVIANLNVLDYEYYFSLTDNFLGGDYTNALLTFNEILAKGFNALNFIAGLSSHFRDLIVCKNKASRTLLDLAPSVAARYDAYSQKCSPRFLFESLGITSACEAAYKQSGNPRLLIEFALMKLCSICGAFADVHQPSPAAPAPAPAAAPASAPAQAAPAPQPVAQPVSAPAPAPASVRPAPAKKRGLSIRDLMAEAAQTPSEMPSEAEAKVEAAAPALSQAAVEEAWTALAENEIGMPARLTSAVRDSKPAFRNEKEIHFEVGNVAQKEWIDRNWRPKLEAFLQKRLANDDVRLFIEVKELDDTASEMLYMPSDKVSYLQKNSDEFRRLKADLDLENA